MVEPVNVVAGGSLNREVDIQTLSSELSKKNDVRTDFTDENRWQLVIEFNEGGKVLLYRTGSYIIRGGSSLDTLEKIKNRWFSLTKKYRRRYVYCRLCTPKYRVFWRFKTKDLFVSIMS